MLCYQFFEEPISTFKYPPELMQIPHIYYLSICSLVNEHLGFLNLPLQGTIQYITLNVLPYWTYTFISMRQWVFCLSVCLLANWNFYKLSLLTAILLLGVCVGGSFKTESNMLPRPILNLELLLYILLYQPTCGLWAGTIGVCHHV